MKIKEEKNIENSTIIFSFLALFFIINLIQGMYTELLNDEAYYWTWSNKPDWGYFDHPPMIAWFIWLGKHVLNGELCVRLVTIFAGVFSFYIIWRLFKKHFSFQAIHFVLLGLCFVFIQIFSFIATPDSPLLFFSVCYLYVFSNYLEKDNAWNSILLGICMAALMYSKYHAIIFIVCSLLPNWKLFMCKPSVYFSIAFGILLYFPHLYWNYAHDFPALNYHLFYRGSSSQFGVGRVFEFLLHPTFVCAVMSAPWLFYYFWKEKAENSFERSLKFINYGVILFFFVFLFKLRTQPQWFLSCSIPLFYFGLKYISNNGLSLVLKRVLLFTVACTLVARILMIIPILPYSFEFHGNKKWVKTISEWTGNNLVVFENSYRRASKYTFYSGVETHSYNNIHYRKNQYNIWNTEEDFQKKSVYFIGKSDSIAKNRSFRMKILNQDTLYLKFYESYTSAENIQFKPFDSSFVINAGKALKIKGVLINEYTRRIYFNDQQLTKKFILSLYNGEKAFEIHTKSTLKFINPQTRIQVEFNYVIPKNLPSGKYQARLALERDQIPGTFNSELFKVIVKP